MTLPNMTLTDIFCGSQLVLPEGGGVLLIRTLAGGTGLMTDALFNEGTRRQPLGDAKAGKSADLDNLATYVASLSRVDASPFRAASGALTAQGVQGQTIFRNLNCASCHGGTIKPSSGKRLGATLTDADLNALVGYLQQIGSEEPAAPQKAP